MGQTSILQIHSDPSEFIEAVAQRAAELLRPLVEQASQPQADPRPLTRREAARYLNVSLTTLTQRENAGQVRGFRSGSRRYYRREDLDASLQAVRRVAGQEVSRG